MMANMLFWQCAALDKKPSVKGGPYSHGCVVQRHHFGRISLVVGEVDERDALRRHRICVRFQGIYALSDVSGDATGAGIDYDTCAPSPPR